MLSSFEILPPSATIELTKVELYNAITAIINNVVKRVKIRKKVHPHLFRHSRATHLAKHLTEAQMKEYFGWTQDSDMASTYIHLSGRDVDDAILKMNGISTPEMEEQESKLKPKRYIKCRLTNAPTATFCQNCAQPLDITAVTQVETKRKEADDLLANIISVPRVQKVMIEEMKKQGLEKKLMEI